MVLRLLQLSSEWWLWHIHILELFLMLGPRPQHVAFIMDGNRRYSDKEHIAKIAGHNHGYRKMVDVIHWCLNLGIKEISVYAFSIENFRRSPDEVNSLMHLAEEKYAELMKENGLAEREGVEMRIIGDLSLPPPSVQGAAARLMKSTASIQRKRALLNICFSYTSSEEVVQAIGSIHDGINKGELLPEDASTDLINECLYTADCSKVDLMIRTSGERRLSDFLSLQANDAFLAFTDKYWPDFTFWDFARCILGFQSHALQQTQGRCESYIIISQLRSVFGIFMTMYQLTLCMLHWLTAMVLQLRNAAQAEPGLGCKEEALSNGKQMQLDEDILEGTAEQSKEGRVASFIQIRHENRVKWILENSSIR